MSGSSDNMVHKDKRQRWGPSHHLHICPLVGMCPEHGSIYYSYVIGGYVFCRSLVGVSHSVTNMDQNSYQSVSLHYAGTA